jgi:hypothetical protein
MISILCQSAVILVCASCRDRGGLRYSKWLGLFSPVRIPLGVFQVMKFKFTKPVTKLEVLQLEDFGLEICRLSFSRFSLPRITLIRERVW